MASQRGVDAPESGLVRIRVRGDVVGAGFLVAPDVVCTCAHVIAGGLGLPDGFGERPEGTVVVEFPLLRDGEGTMPAVNAEVATWRPMREDGGGDVALLRLDSPVPDARPVPLVDGTAVWGHTFRAYGFPPGADHGIWGSGTLRAAQGAGWLQMDTGPGGRPIEQGFSGAAVWDDTQGGVIGMTVAAGRGSHHGVAFLLPSAELVDEDVLHTRCPFQGLAAFQEEHAEFFHGRREESTRLREAVALHPLTVLAGPSGCGKSSLVRAGLLPRLREAGTTVSELRPVPGVRPAIALAQAVTPVLEPEAGVAGRLRKAEDLAELLDRGLRDGRIDEPAAGVRAALLERSGPGGHLLFVDQLEEYAGAEPVAAGELFALLDALAGVPDTVSGRGLRVVTTARPDSLGALVTPGTSDTLSDAVLFLAPLDAAGLLDAVAGPVDAVPGVWLEPGLAERIVQDAAGEPGRMPMVEFTLTELWGRRKRSMLTHAAYEKLGGVAGALVGYAEKTFDAHVTASEVTVAERLFVQLARPDEQGGFVRRATPVADLEPAVAAIARRLASGKLVIFGRTPEGAEIVDLAHEALTRLWPRLHRWLNQNREFRGWQEQLRRDMARWARQGREAGGLLRGRLLADAVDWLEQRPADITATERAYIEAGRRHERRTVRRWQAAVAGLTALVMVATVLAVVAWQSRRETETKLRTLASRTLADESDTRSDHDPGTALQLALAAWRTEHTAQAREALLRQYVRGQDLRGVRTGLWRGAVHHLDATPDGRTLVVRSKPEGGDPVEASVVTGVLGGKPHHYRLRGLPGGEQGSAVSPDGRRYAVATADGTVRLWLLDGRSREPEVVVRGGAENLAVTGTSLDFSADGGRLLRLLQYPKAQPGDDGRLGRLNAWDLRSGRRLPVADDVIPARSEPKQAAFGNDPDTVVIPWSRDASDEVTVRELRTGRAVRTVADRSKGTLIRLAGGGAYALEQRRSTGGTYVHDIATGVSRRLPNGSVLTDAAGRYTTQDEKSGEGGYAEIALSQLPGGDTYRVRIPTDNEPGYSDPLFAAVPRSDGGATVLAPVGDTLMTLVARPGALSREGTGLLADSAPASDGRRMARVGEDGLEIVDTVDGSGEAVALPRARLRASFWRVAWTQRSGRLVVWQEGGTRLYFYDVDNMKKRVEVPLDAGPDTGKPVAELDAVEPLAGGDVAALTAGGALLRVDPERGVQTGEPLRADRRPVDLEVSFPGIGRLRARPRHPHEVAVVTRNGTEDGTVQVWNLQDRERTAVLSGDKIRPTFPAYNTNPMYFSPDGGQLVVQHNDGYLHRWAVADGRTAGPRIPAGGSDRIIGFTGHGTLLTSALATDDFVFWRTDRATRIGRVPPINTGHSRVSLVRGDRLITVADGWRQTFGLRSDAWFRHLCQAANRDYTRQERDLLAPGTPPGPPCGTTGAQD